MVTVTRKVMVKSCEISNLTPLTIGINININMV
jgi:hypothetical protein